MRNNSISIILVIILSFLTFLKVDAQIFDPTKGCVIDVASGSECVPNTVLTAVPFLRITPDARSGGMGDAGIATSVDPNAMHFNASKLAFVEDDLGLSMTYTPWLRDLGLSDVYLAYLSGYKQIDELQTLGFSLRFFSLGDITFTDINGGISGQGKPREMELAFAYARKLTNSFSAAMTAKYIYSNLASGQVVGGFDVSSANSFAADLSMTYQRDLNMGARGTMFRFGAAVTNLGSKISYTNNSLKDFLPGNLGLGAAMDYVIDDYNKINFTLDINKLLVPSPIAPYIIDANGDQVINPEYDADGDLIPDYRQVSTFSGIFGSFADAQGGFSEEMAELMYAFGFEYWYADQFAVRAGYYYENKNKGDRQFLTLGVGLNYNVFGLSLSYLVPTSNRNNPLNNTLRFTLNFNFGAYENSKFN